MVLEVQDLHKTYRKGFIPKSFNVLKGVNFSIPAGTITGFLGANGAGKTTTMKCVLGLNHRDQGQIRYFGQNELTVDIKKRIGYLPERPYFYDYLTGEEFLRFYGELSLNMTASDLKDRITQMLKRVDLMHVRDKSLREYSKGMLQKIGIAQALIHRPELLILDEPVSGLDPDGRQALREIIQETAKSGTAVFFSSHLLHDAETLCENLVMLKDGRVIYDGKTQALLSSLQTGYEIVYDDKDQLRSEKVDKVDMLQSRIDEIRKQSRHIHEVRIARMSLEDAFVQMAMRS